MNRKEAMALVGKLVRAWTSANGEYVGEVVEVLTPKGRPWRARVKITGVASTAANEYSRSGNQRWGKRPGQVIEVGGVSVRPLAEGAPTTATYLDVLRADLAQANRWQADHAKQVETFHAAARNATDSGERLRAERALQQATEALRFDEWHIKEIGRLIEQEPARLAKIMAEAKPAKPAEAPKDSFDQRVTDLGALRAEMAREGIEGTVVDATETVGTIVQRTLTVTGVVRDGKIVAAYRQGPWGPVPVTDLASVKEA